MNKLLKPALLVALAAMSGGAAAQTYSNNQSGEVIMQILQSVLGSRYQTDNRYQTREQQQAFILADTNRDGVLTQYEVDAYRARYGYSDNRYNDNRYNDGRYDNRDNRYRVDRRGVRVSRVDLNRDGWISRAEQDAFIRLIEQERRYGY